MESAAKLTAEGLRLRVEPAAVKGTDKMFAEMFRSIAGSALGKLARDAVYPNTRISIESGGDIQIDSCRRILVCNDVCIKIRSADMIIELWGSGLRLSCAEPDSVSVSGKVTSVDFTPLRKGKSR